MLAFSCWCFVVLVLGLIEFHAGIITARDDVQLSGRVISVIGGLAWSVTLAVCVERLIEVIK